MLDMWDQPPQASPNPPIKLPNKLTKYFGYLFFIAVAILYSVGFYNAGQSLGAVISPLVIVAVGIALAYFFGGKIGKIFYSIIGGLATPKFALGSGLFMLIAVATMLSTSLAFNKQNLFFIICPFLFLAFSLFLVIRYGDKMLQLAGKINEKKIYLVLLPIIVILILLRFYMTVPLDYSNPNTIIAIILFIVALAIFYLIARLFRWLANKLFEAIRNALHK